MFKGAFARYRALFFAVTGLIVFFLLFLAINTALISQAIKASNYPNIVKDAGKSIASGTNKNTSIVLLNQLKNGVSGDFDPIDKFLTPDKSGIEQIIKQLADGDTGAASSTMQRLSVMVNEKAEKKQNLVKVLQIVAAILVALLYFLLLIPLFIRLSQSKETEQIAQKEAEGIMGTVSEGLFLLDSNHEIGVEQSASLKGMFKLDRDLEGNFFDFILQYVTQDNVNIAKDYIELLFGDRVKEKLVEDLNPLKQVEINIIRRDGSYENRYLDFKFKRVLVDGKLSHLLGSVTDVTKQVMLERELIESREEQEAQIDLLMSILHVDNQQLDRFFTSTTNSLNTINETLEARGHSTSEIRAKLEDISREVHKVKGDAASLNLNNFEFAAHALEDEIKDVQSTNGKIAGKQLLPATTKLRDLYSELERMKSLVDKFSTALTSNASVPSNVLDELKNSKNEASSANDQDFSGEQSTSSESSDQPSSEQTEDLIHEDSLGLVDQLDENLDELSDDENDEILVDAMQQTEPQADTEHPVLEYDFTTIAQLAENVGNRNDITVNYTQEGIGNDQIPSHLGETIHSTLIQLVRNSIVHAGEPEEIRLSNGKSAALNIHASFSNGDGGYLLKVRDDGKGIDNEKVLQKALENELITSEQAEKLDPQKAIALIFRPGFSSRDSADIDGGRGVGLDVVLKQTRDSKGKISVRSAKNKGTTFSFSYPLDQE